VTHSEYVDGVDELFGVLAVTNRQRDEALRQLNNLARRYNALAAAVDQHKRAVLQNGDHDAQHEADLELWRALDNSLDAE